MSFNLENTTITYDKQDNEFRAELYLTGMCDVERVGDVEIPKSGLFVARGTGLTIAMALSNAYRDAEVRMKG